VDDGSRELVDAALSGDERAIDTLIHRLMPVVEQYVGFVLARSRRGGRDVHQDKEDFVQEVMLKLFHFEKTPLRKWNPEISGLDSYVGVITKNAIIAILKIKKKNPWMADPTEAEALERLQGAAGRVDLEVAARELLRLVDAVIKERFSEQRYRLFQLIYVEERSVEEVCELMKMTPDAVFQARARFKKDLPQIVEEILSEKGTRPRKPGGG
jgi:RNA polymerase sigma factor (sigma-70 family)